jgi:hypothetical protein
MNANVRQIIGMEGFVGVRRVRGFEDLRKSQG